MIPWLNGYFNMFSSQIRLPTTIIITDSVKWTLWSTLLAFLWTTVTVTQTGSCTVYTNTSGHWSESARYHCKKWNSIYWMHNTAIFLPMSLMFSWSRNTHNGITIYSPVLRRGSLVPRLRPQILNRWGMRLNPWYTSTKGLSINWRNL